MTDVLLSGGPADGETVSVGEPWPRSYLRRSGATYLITDGGPPATGTFIESPVVADPGGLTNAGPRGPEGPQGPQGPMGAPGPEGPAGPTFVPRGEWADDETYATLDVVHYGDASWVSVADTNIAHEPGVLIDGDAWWELLVEDGEQGPVGPAGPEGPPGTGSDVVTLNWRGNYVDAETYEADDLVRYQGSLWRAPETMTGSAPTTASSPPVTTPTLIIAGVSVVAPIYTEPFPAGNGTWAVRYFDVAVAGTVNIVNPGGYLWRSDGDPVAGGNYSGSLTVGRYFFGSNAASGTCSVAENTATITPPPAAWDLLAGLTIGAWQAVTFASGWSNYGSVFPTVAYRKDSNGFVHLRGTMTGAIGTTAFTLPAGYRPDYLTSGQQAIFIAPSGGTGIVVVMADGQVQPQVGSNSYTGLDGISFYAGP